MTTVSTTINRPDRARRAAEAVVAAYIHEIAPPVRTADAALAEPRGRPDCTERVRTTLPARVRRGSLTRRRPVLEAF